MLATDTILHPADDEDVPGPWWGESAAWAVPAERRAIILVGYMCVGKTTVGKALAERLGRTFYDLDWYIEERYRMKVPEIFARRGEQAFRQLERRMLHEAAAFEQTVLSCGGGTPCFFDNMEYMNSVGRVVYLKATPQTILAHLALSRGERPLLRGKSPAELEAFVTEQLAGREPYYRRAAYTVEVSPLDDFDKIDAIVSQIISRTGAATARA